MGQNLMFCELAYSGSDPLIMDQDYLAPPWHE